MTGISRNSFSTASRSWMRMSRASIPSSDHGSTMKLKTYPLMFQAYWRGAFSNRMSGMLFLRVFLSVKHGYIRHVIGLMLAERGVELVELLLSLAEKSPVFHFDDLPSAHLHRVLQRE